MSGTTNPCWFPGRGKNWRRILILLILGLLLWAELSGCSKLASKQIKAGFKSGGTVLQITNTGSWDWPNLAAKINRYEKAGPYGLIITQSLKSGQSVNLALSSFQSKNGDRFNPAKNKVETVSLIVAGEERTFRFN